MMKLIKGYKIVALIQIFMCVCFFLNPGLKAYGGLFTAINFIGAGALFVGSVLAYFDTKKWTLWLMAITMLILIFFNAVWFILSAEFLAGFPLIGYDLLFVAVNFHFLRKGL